MQERSGPMNRQDILYWLRERRPEHLEELWQRADNVRAREVGEAVHLRGLVEISNTCRRRCAYCGLGAHRSELQRYRLASEDILASASRAGKLGYGTVVLQAGEDPQLDTDELARTVETIRSRHGLAVTLSLGELGGAALRRLRDAGADRYLLRFETSDERLYAALHPDQPSLDRRLDTLRLSGELGYEVGSGVMVGLPGQSVETLADDLELFDRLELDMIGLGPYLPHPDSPLARGKVDVPATDDQAHSDEITACVMVALTRLIRPKANIPATTALATLCPQTGRELGLRCGANVIMPNLTPRAQRALYEIYPQKACLAEDEQTFHDELCRRIHALGRSVGRGRGDSPAFLARTQAKRQEVS